MTALKRYADFADLKMATKSNKQSDVINSKKVKELESFFKLLRSNLVTKKTS
jgi:hypothetical protein